jgi:cytochrome b pre-mRNA-processing protein 3
MGTGDLSVGREVKRMAQAFFGRIDAYERGLSGGDAVLKSALARNLFGTVTAEETALEAMAGYIRRESAQLQQQAVVELLAGQVAFGQPPSTASTPQEASAS